MAITLNLSRNRAVGSSIELDERVCGILYSLKELLDSGSAQFRSLYPHVVSGVRHDKTLTIGKQPSQLIVDQTEKVKGLRAGDKQNWCADFSN